MLRIGIIGATSYIGLSFKKYIENLNVANVIMINSRRNTWKDIDFSSFDSIIFAAGIAHVSTKASMESTYFSINRDLPFIVAKKAKVDGLKQFIFLSSMIVYGDDFPIGKEFIISNDTKPIPLNFYGQSKLEAENLLLSLADNDFKVGIIRLPMVYGPRCKGNFQSLITFAKKTLIFPSLNNRRSMIFIDNLSAFMHYVIAEKMDGHLFPQNTMFVSTKQIIEEISRIKDRRVYFVFGINGIIRLLSYKISILRKIFGTKIYAQSLSDYNFNYNIVDFKKSIFLSLNDKEKL